MGAVAPADYRFRRPDSESVHVPSMSPAPGPVVRSEARLLDAHTGRAAAPGSPVRRRRPPPRAALLLSRVRSWGADSQRRSLSSVFLWELVLPFALKVQFL